MSTERSVTMVTDDDDHPVHSYAQSLPVRTVARTGTPTYIYICPKTIKSKLLVHIIAIKC